MIKKYLILHNNEKLLVDDIAGYPGCTILEENVDVPIHDHFTRKNGKWVEDKAAKDAADKKAKIHSLKNEDLVAMIDALDARIKALEANKNK